MVERNLRCLQCGSTDVSFLDECPQCGCHEYESLPNNKRGTEAETPGGTLARLTRPVNPIAPV